MSHPFLIITRAIFSFCKSFPAPFDSANLYFLLFLHFFMVFIIFSMSRSQNDDLYELRQRYDIKETIGSGGFGKVKRAIHLPTGETVAIKV